MINGQNGHFVLKFVVKSKVNHFDHGKYVFWSWSKSVFLWLNFLSKFEVNHLDHEKFGFGHGRNFDHLTIVISKFWPRSWSKIFDHMTMTPVRRPNGKKIMVALPPHPLT